MCKPGTMNARQNDARCTIRCTLHDARCTLHDARCTKRCTLHDARYTMHDKRCTLHETMHAGEAFLTAFIVWQIVHRIVRASCVHRAHIVRTTCAHRACIVRISHRLLTYTLQGLYDVLELQKMYKSRVKIVNLLRISDKLKTRVKISVYKSEVDRIIQQEFYPILGQR